MRFQDILASRMRRIPNGQRGEEYTGCH